MVTNRKALHPQHTKGPSQLVLRGECSSAEGLPTEEAVSLSARKECVEVVLTWLVIRL